MTQLSKALTGETPEERLQSLSSLVEALVGKAIPDAIKVVIIQETMLNERTLFIDEARYGKRAPATDPMTAAPTPSPPVKQEAQPEARECGMDFAGAICHLPYGHNPKHVPHVFDVPTSTAAKSPLAGPLPPQAAKPGRSVVDVTGVLEDDGRLPKDMFGNWRKLGKGDYPVTKQARIAALTALSDAERYLLMTGGRA